VFPAEVAAQAGILVNGSIFERDQWREQTVHSGFEML
jgi:hypothetical protein